MHGGKEKCMQGFGGETGGKIPFGRPDRRII
jgi:hypothetical protein